MTTIEKFFKETLDNKMGYVSVGGVRLEGTLEQKCKLEFIQYTGVRCSIKTEYNNLNTTQNVEKILIEHKDSWGLTYHQRDDIINTLIPKLKNMYVQVGVLSYYGVNDIKSTYDSDGSVTSVDIEYENGSILKITNIEEIKDENNK